MKLSLVTSFGIGLFGLAILAIFAIVLLRSDVWKLGEKTPVKSISTEKRVHEPL